MKLAFVYDRLNKIGGAERLLIALHQIWPQAPFFTAVHHPATAPFSQNWQVQPSFIQQIPLARTHHELFPWLMPWAFESFSFDQFDVVISITSAEAKGIITRPETLHICYCLTPTRYLWSHTFHYQKNGNIFLKPLRTFLLTKLRLWDQIAASRPDQYLAISKTVKQRISKYYQRDSEVIYPPVDTSFFKPRTSKKITSRQLPCTDYFLVVSRLVAYKRIELAVAACKLVGAPLVVVGVGEQMGKLKRLAGKNTHFVGELTEAKLLEYYQNCRALLFPGEEDFGLTILEALSVGKPVIAYRQGGATETIKHKKTGIFFDTLSVQGLAQSLKQFEKLSFNPANIRNSTAKFDRKIFQHKFKQKVKELWHDHQKSCQ